MYGGIKVKTLKNKTVRALGALFVCAAFAFGMTACSNGSDTQVVYVPVAKYTVTISSGMTNGSVTADKTSAAKDETVTLAISPASGYKLDTLAVTAEGGASVAVSGTGNSRTFAMPAQDVTVSATFAVTFGLWPQTIKADSVTVNESETETHGAFTYCKGSDGEWYAKIKENAYIYSDGEYKYSDGTTVAQSSANSYKWFKVEPIKWLVLTTDYNGTGKKLLLSEKILANCAYYDYFNVNRTVSEATVYPNNYEHSKVRAFLNGISYQKKADGSAEQAACDDFLNKGFLQSAFTAEELAKIVETTVDNSAGSTIDSGYNLKSADFYACANTSDKVFLLSEREVTTSAYGFAAYDAQGEGNKRIRFPTDYAKASGAYQNATEDMGGWWWLRSPAYGGLVHYVNSYGRANNTFYAAQDDGCVVPALCVSN